MSSNAEGNGLLYGKEGLAPFIGDTEGILLDFDGVLADSEPVFRRSWNEALRPWGHTIGEKDYWKYWSSLGEGLEGEMERHGLGSVDADEARARQRSIYLGFVENGEVPLFSGTADLLRRLLRLQESSGIVHCIASNTPGTIVRSVLERHGAPVPVIIGGEGLEKKPSPAIFNRAASVLGIRPSAGIVAEDSWKGVAAARRGGFRSVLVINDYNHDLAIDSDFRVSGLDGLMEFLHLEPWPGPKEE